MREEAVNERYYFVNEDFPKATIYRYVLDCNQSNRTGIAFDYLGARITYGALFRMVDKTAASLTACGILPGDIVSLVMPTQPETFYLLYACSKIGAIANLIDPRYPKDYLCDAVERTHSKLVFGSTVTGVALVDALDKLVMVAPGESIGLMEFAKSERVREAAKHAPMNEFEGRCPTWRGFLKAGKEKPAPETNYAPDRTVVMVGTGGTTGIPKLVELSNDAINAAVFQCRHANFDFRKGDVWYDIMPPFIAYGVVDGLHLPLCMGMTVILEPAPGVESLVETLAQGRVNHMTASPSFYIDLSRREDARKLDLSMVRSPIVGGRSVNPRQESAINDMLASCGCDSRLRVGWGLTESCGAISVAGSNALVKTQSVGPTLTGGVTAAFRKTNDTSENEKSVFERMPLVPAGTEPVLQEHTGELWYSGPNVMTGYFENEKETAAVLVEHDGRHWLRTGDVGYVDSEGSVFITNRLKDFIARKDGFKTPPKEIEDVLVRSGRIDEVAVVGAADPAYEGNTLIVAFYTLLEGQSATDAEAAMREVVAQKLADYKHPDYYSCLDRMPYTPVSKIDRNALRAQGEMIANRKANKDE